MKNLSLIILICTIFTSMVYSQNNTRTDSISVKTVEQESFRRHSVGSSLFVSFNWLVEDPADYYLLTYGYQLTKKDRIFVEFNTWKYNEPIGTYDNSKEKYPGKVRAYGIGVGYQRFHWENLFTTIVATSFLQQFYDEDDEKIQKGFQLYLQFVLGYRFEFFEKSFYVEPALALKYWPVNTNFPKSFADIEQGKPKHIFEPSLNFGYRF